MEKVVHITRVMRHCTLGHPTGSPAQCRSFTALLLFYICLDCFLHRNLSRSLLYFVKQSLLPLQGCLKLIRVQSWENYSANFNKIVKHLPSLPFLFSSIITVISMRTLSILFGVKSSFLVRFIKFHLLGFHILSCCYH